MQIRCSSLRGAPAATSYGHRRANAVRGVVNARRAQCVSRFLELPGLLPINQRHRRGAKRKREPLTRTQRNNQARAKALEQERAAKAAEKKRERQLGRVGALEAEIKREERARAARQAEEAAREAARVRKLGPRRHVEKRPDVLLSDEQPTALRQMVTEGSLLDDRFESMQARNLIEVRDKNTKPSRRHMKKVLREGSKDAKYLSPHGYAGKMPAWL